MNVAVCIHIARRHTVYAAVCWLFGSIASAATLTIDLNAPTDVKAKQFASIAGALPHIKPGDTVLLASGVYRDAIDLRNTSLIDAAPASQPTTFEAAPDANVVIKGSDVVTGWVRVNADTYAKHEWTVNTQQVFVDGAPLKQIGGLIYGDFPENPEHSFATLHASQGGIWPSRIKGNADSLTAESFFYDVDAKTLYVRTATDIARGAAVEVSTRPYLVFGTGLNKVEFHNLKFEHATTTSVSQSGAITLTGNRLVLSNLSVQYVDGAGIDVTGNNNEVNHSRANYCGIVGLKVRGLNARVIGNETNFNNTRGFNKWWEAGGAKFVGAGGLHHSEVSWHRAFANNGDGLWFDWQNDTNRIHHNVVAYNAGMGIHYEASRRALIYDNYVYGNTQRGIYLPNSSNSVVAHNLIAANDMEGLAIVDERNAVQNDKPALIPSGNRVVANIIAWNSKVSLVIPADVDTRSDANAFVGTQAPTFSIGWASVRNPVLHGLQTWRSKSEQDANSIWRSATPPTDIQQRPDTQTITWATAQQTWQTLLNSVSTQRTPELSFTDTSFVRPGTPPGPGR